MKKNNKMANDVINNVTSLGIFYFLFLLLIRKWRKLAFALFKKTIQRFVPFPKLIRERPLF